MPTVDMEKIRAKIVADFPLFSGFMFGLEMRENPNIKTLRVNMKELEYNPFFMERKSPVAQLFYILHELAHVFLGHPIRMRQEHAEEYIQRAADYAVNDLLADYGFELPVDALWDHRYTGMGMEEIYGQIVKQNPPHPQKQWSKNRHGQCDEQEPDPQPGQDPHEKDNSNDPLKGETKHGNKQQQLEDHEQKQIEAIQQAKMQGSMPRNLARKLEKLVEPELDWRQVLPTVIEQEIGMDDYTYNIPERRYDSEIILPGMFSEKRGNLVIAVDTSGSVSRATIKKMASEVMGVVEQINPEITTVIWCDVRVQGVQEFTSTDQPELDPAGGGGTDFRPPFDLVAKADSDPMAMVYMTDGHCNRFPKEPHYPVVWLVWGDNTGFKPPFGKVVMMTKPGEKRP